MISKSCIAVLAAAVGLGCLPSAEASRLILAVQSGAPRGVSSFNGTTGASINTTYASIAGTGTPRGIATDGSFLYISDQLNNNVLKYTLNGSLVGTVLTSTQIANPRGLSVYNNRLYVTCGNAINGNTGGSVQSFALDGTDQQTFIPTLAASGNTPLWSPFDIAFRGSDVLVSNFGNGGNSNAALADVLSFPLNGGSSASTFVLDATGLSSASQLYLRANGNVVVAGFSNVFGGGATAGLYEYSSSGSLVRYVKTATGPRGVTDLENGNFLFTDATGVRVINPDTLATTTVGSFSSQYVINLPEPSLAMGLLPVAGLMFRRRSR